MPSSLPLPRSAFVFQRHPAVVLRRDGEGGFAFHRENGDLLELDEEGFDVLANLSEPKELRHVCDSGSERQRRKLPETVRFLRQLELCQFVHRLADKCPPPLGNDWLERANDVFGATDRASHNESLTAPLVAHWAVTYRCNLACSFCYSESGPHREREPAAEVRLRIAHRLAEWGVFEVALGGGEPTILPDFAELLAEIRRLGMVPNVTTNGMLHGKEIVKSLAEYAGVVHLSADRPDLLDTARGAGVFARLRETAKRLTSRDVRWGINLLITPDNAPLLDQTLSEMQTLGASAVTLLRPKGDWAARCWPGFPTLQNMQEISRALEKFIEQRPAMRLYVDTALRYEWSQAGLFHDPEPDVLGCGGGQRHVAITPEGNVYPCSHARWPKLFMGNLLSNNLQELWQTGNGNSARTKYSNLCQETICPCRLCFKSLEGNEVL